MKHISGNPGSSKSANEASEIKCSFCGKIRQDVRTMLVSGECVICDECVVVALDTISRTRSQFHLRIAFFIFRAVGAPG
jgi:hypothetical protein